MKQRLILAVLAATGLAACDQSQIVSRGTVDGLQPLTGSRLAIHRLYEDSFGEAPFANGAMSIVTTEHGDLRSYRLVPCHNGIICAGSARGRHGTVEVTEDFTIVRGLYGRTFWLSPGGDGAVERHGRITPLAWDSDIIEVGIDGLMRP